MFEEYVDKYFEYFGLTGGVLLILAVGIVLFLAIAFIAERKTKALFPDRKRRGDDDGGFFDFDDDDE